MGVGCPKCKQLTANAEAAVKELNIDIRSVIASTLGAEAIDTLYVTEVTGEKLSTAKAEEVVASIRSAID